MHDTSSIDRTQPEPLDWRMLAVEPLNSSEGHCDCCGTATRRVWGFVSREECNLATFFVDWTIDRPDHGARFEVILGRWGEETDAGERAWIALDYRVVDGQGAFRVADMPALDTAKAELAATALNRDAVIGTPIASQIFAIADAVIAKDARLAELRAWR